MSLKSRLLLATLSLVLFSIVLMGVVSVQVAVNGSNAALTDAAKDRLVSQNVQTNEAVLEYFNFITSQIRTKAFDISVVEATQGFINAFNQYTSQRGVLDSTQKQQLENYYSKDFTQQYNASNPTPTANVENVLSNFSNTTLTLQYDFIAGSPYPLGEKDTLYDLNNGSTYASLHSRYHPSFRNYLQEFGYYDIFIADIQTGNIVYSVFKELDYATNISTGPYADSGIGRAFAQAANSSEEGKVFYSRFEKYRPSYDALAGFASTAIYSQGKAIAVLIFQMPMDKINSVLTHSEHWADNGFGETGETYLLNDESYLVTEPRFFIEDKPLYLEIINKNSSDLASQISAKGTTVGIQSLKSEAAQKALSGDKGFARMKDYQGVEVFVSYSPLKIGKYNYALLAEMDVEEALRAATTVSSRLIKFTLVESFILLGISIVITLWIASRLIRPLENLGQTCEELSDGEGDLTIQIVHSGIPEIDRISNGFNTFIQQIRDIIAQVKIDADSLSTASQQLLVITADSVQKTQDQRDQTKTVSTAMEQLSLAVSDVNESTLKTSKQSIDAQTSLNENMERADLAADNIKLLVQLIDDSSTVIYSLKDEVNQITTVLNVITSIADQTNLLALNAAIEAARAGEAGRGFSVVADEVRALATRSRESTVEISNLVEVMNQSANKSVSSMERATEAASGGIHLVDLVTVALDELSENLKQVLQLTDTVATATEQQANASESVVANVKSISLLAEAVEGGSEQTSEAAQNLAKIAKKAGDLVARFKV
ncbi:methyl-accepting chemotaxis protein [Paraglaciecola sp. 2405UD69-4]|uniref:methyl-accepting chemotaxis protein n=1 Tax=Paraglaciecola sp. 2405UD69-4 TaxID=3391836 RepID=UPI0039C9400F